MTAADEYERILRERLPVVARCGGCGQNYLAYPDVTKPCPICGGRILVVEQHAEKDPDRQSD